MEEIGKLYETIPSGPGPAFPSGWRGLPAGRQVCLLAARLVPGGWSKLTVDQQNRCRKLFVLLSEGAIRPVESGASAPQPTSSRTTEDLAMVGDVLHKLHLVLIVLAKGLVGPAKSDWLHLYGSNLHQARYLATLLGIPVPESKTGIHKAGTQFEAQYTSRSFRETYLRETFGPEFAQLASTTVGEFAI